MPRLQKFVEQYKNDPNVQFLTLNLDENPGAIEPFLRQHKLTFTVLLAYDYAQGSLHLGGIPENWIVDANGVVPLKEIGYDATAKWQTGLSAAIQRYAPATPAPTAHTPRR